MTYDPSLNSFFGEIVGLPQVMWHVTDKCPLSCPYCFATKTDISVDPNLIEEYVGALAGLGVQKVDIGGGEPLVYPHLDECLAALDARGISTTLTTSGTGSPRPTSWAVDNAHRFTRIIVSLDGPEQLHDRLRGRRGTFARLTNFVRSLQATGYEQIRVNTVVTPELEPLAEELLSAIVQLQPAEWCLVQPHPANSKADWNKFEVSSRDFEREVLRYRALSLPYSWEVISRTRELYSGYWVLYPDGQIRPHSNSDADGDGFHLLGTPVSLLRTAVAEAGVRLPGAPDH